MELLKKKDMSLLLKCSFRQIDRLAKREVIPEPIYLDSNPRWDKDLVEVWLRDQFDMDEFEEKFMQLPANCPVVELLGWIAIHPAMTRRKKGRRDVILRVEDNEGAPSRAAVNQLQSFVNRPDDFFGHFLNRQMKVSPD